MSTVFTTGSWTPNPGREEPFVEAWSQFAAWASGQPGAGRLRLVRDLRQPGRFTSFGEWESAEAVREWKLAPEFRVRMAEVLRHVEAFEPAELALVATATEGTTTIEPGGA